MHYLLCILLKEPDLIREADPLDEILEVWKQFGLPSAMLLRHVNLHDIMCYGAAAFAPAFHEDNGSVASFLFEAPQSRHDPVLNGEPQEHHRMVLTLVDGAHIELEPLLDATEAILQERTQGDDNDLLFVFPVVHVRGFPGTAGPKPRRRNAPLYR